MSTARALLVLPLLAALVAGCGASPADERREAVAALTEAANDGDASRVRTQAEALLETVVEQRGSGELAEEEAQRLTELAEAVLSSADAIDEDLLERRRAEAEAEQARRELEEAQKQLEEERRKAEENKDGERKNDKGKRDKDDEDD